MIFYIFIVQLCLLFNAVSLYSLPPVNLGFTSFLDGGPLRPSPGFYAEEYTQYYYSNKFLDGSGKKLGGIPSPTFNSLAVVFEFVYQWEHELLFKGARPGISTAVPAILYSRIERSPLGLTNSGSGLGDIFLGVYIQWDPIMLGGRPFFVHRIEFDVSFPAGKNKEPKKIFNPGNHFFFINPYWAATLFFTEWWAVSWRLHYLWCDYDDKTHIKYGDAWHINFTTEVLVHPDLWVGINGYFLQQIKDNKLNGISIPNSRERVFGIGPGFLYSLADNFDFALFGNLYFECDVRNRPQGISAVVRFFKYF